MDPVNEVMRNDGDAYSWHDLRPLLDTALTMATDMNLLTTRKVLSDTIARGARMLKACGDPVMVLGVFSKMLPSVHGVSQEVHEADCAELRKVRALDRVLNGAGAASGVVAAGPPPARPITGPHLGNAFQTAQAQTGKVRAPAATRAAAGQNFYGPVRGGGGGGRGRGGARGGGGGGGGAAGGGAHGLTPAEVATLRATRASQHHAEQQRQLNTPGNPSLGEVCRNCRVAGRDHFHSHLTCAWQICLTCKLAGHRRAACTGTWSPDV